jgi:hypothetical protein
MTDEITKAEEVVKTDVAAVKTEVASVVKSTPSFLSKVGSFFSGLEATINTKIGGMKTVTAILIGVAGIVGAIFLELTGALRLLVIVPTVVGAVGAAGKFLIDILVWVVSGAVSLLQILLPLIIVAGAVYIIIDSLKKK